jgi:aspartyl-tRNA synthetase
MCVVKFPRATHTVGEITDRHENLDVIIHGFIKSVRRVNKNTIFLRLYDFLKGPNNSIQLVSTIETDSTEEQKAAHAALLKLPPFVPVAITGVVVSSNIPPPPAGLIGKALRDWKDSPANRPEIRLKSLRQLNSVAPFTYTPETIFPPEKRHLQLRTYEPLARALRLRDDASAKCRSFLRRNGFMEVETPLLFKSTPEGAREFLVPTRSKENGGGMCYALPQSPQQYKQILMASGVARYFQFAKCFRDEDLRADRQPEFTQLDLEMSFARQADVMDIITRLLRELFLDLLQIEIPYMFTRMTYWEAMKAYGIDKPDLRFGRLKVSSIEPLHDSIIC